MLIAILSSVCLVGAVVVYVYLRVERLKESFREQEMHLGSIIGCFRDLITVERGLTEMHQKELDASRLERRELYTRIQAWDASPAEPSKTPDAESQPPKIQSEEKVWTSQDLLVLGLRENSDGGYIENSSGDLFETVEDFREWKAHLRKSNLPLNMSPRIAREQGMGAAFDAAKAGKDKPVP